jgi:hypothetical protein
VYVGAEGLDQTKGSIRSVEITIDRPGQFLGIGATASVAANVVRVEICIQLL